MGWKRDVIQGTYEATFTQKFKTSLAGGGGQTVEQKVVVVANPQTGSYDLYKVSKVAGIEVGGRGAPFATVSGVTGKVTPLNQSTFDAFYSGTDGQNQLKTLTTSVKTGFYNELKKANDPISVQQVKNLEKNPYYAPLANQPQTQPAGADPTGIEPKDGTDSQTPLVESGGDTQTVQNADEGGSIGFDPNTLTRGDFSKNEESLSENEILKYPLKMINGCDYLSISCYSYIPTTFTQGQITVQQANERIELKGVKPVGTVHLPLQSASESNSVSWGEDRLNAIQIAGSGIAKDVIRNYSQGDIIGGTREGIEGLKNALAKAGAQLSENDIIAYFAGQAVNSNIYTRSTGQVLNDNLELLFGGTTLRSFGFNYRFTPRSSDEALMVKKIIKFFKKQMSAKKDELFLGTPNVFKLKYIYGKTGGQHPYLNQIKICALVGFNVNYIPDNSYMTYQDGSMTSYVVDMSFRELNPIYSSDISLNDNTQGTGY